MSGYERTSDASSAWAPIYAGLRGATVDELRRWSVGFATLAAGAGLPPRMGQEVEQLRADGISCVLVTSGPRVLADALARRLDLAFGLGTVLGNVDGVLTGRVEGPIWAGDAKASQLRDELTTRVGAFSVVAAYSGSAQDVPLLMSALEPIAVNADDELAVIAERNKWRVIHGRRDEARAVRASCAHVPFYFS